MDHSLANNAIGRFQRRFDVAFSGSQFVSDVVTELFMNDSSAFCRRFYVDNCRQLFILDGN